MHRLALATALLAVPGHGQSVYDFNALNGSDPHPFTLLDGQDNWTEQTYNASNRCGVTATLAFDGTKGLRFQEVGPGFGCDASRINDASWAFAPFTSGERNAYFQADMRCGYWGGQFGLAFDANQNGQVRAAEAGERGVRFELGSYSTVQLKLVPASGTSVNVPIASLGIAGGHWVRVRVVMDFTVPGGRGHVHVQNLSAGANGFTLVPGLQNVPLGLDVTVPDGRNPALWHAMWLHFEGATYELDNIEVGRAAFALPYGSGCVGAGGPVALTVQGPPTPGGTLQLASGNHAPGALGVVIFGLSNTAHAGQPLPLLLDPLLGTAGCSLLASIDATAIAFASASAPATMTWQVTLPLAVTGHRFYTQHACFEPVPGGLSFSNGVVLQAQ
jgi:hypothetical protein